MKKHAANSPKTIIISGASSGIGKALAQHYADQGITLGLIARNPERLEQTKRHCEEKGAIVETLACDLQEYETLKNWVDAFDHKNSVDLVISNAGISGGTGETNTIERIEDIKRIYDTNVFAAIYLGQLLFETFQERQKGQIVFTGSIAGFQGWAGAPAYTSSKSAIHTYAESLRMLGKRNNIKVNIIAPGFVKSAMTDQNEFPMPFMISAEKAATIIKKGIEKNKPYIIFPKRMYALSVLARMLPEFLLTYVSQRTKGKTNI